MLALQASLGLLVSRLRTRSNEQVPVGRAVVPGASTPLLDVVQYMREVRHDKLVERPPR